MKNTTDITNIGDVRISIFKYVLNISPGGRKCAAKGRRIFAGGLLDYFCFFLEMGLVGGQFHHKSRLGGAQGANRFVEMVQAVSSRLEMTAPTPLFDVVDPFGARFFGPVSGGRGRAGIPDRAVALTCHRGAVIKRAFFDPLHRVRALI